MGEAKGHRQYFGGLLNLQRTPSLVFHLHLQLHRFALVFTFD
jgi:hypothetical protein